MIAVGQHGTNYIVLKGDKLRESITRSLIALHPDGWQLVLNIEGSFALVDISYLRRNEVIPRLKFELQDHYIDQDVDEYEILRYMDFIQRWFGEF